MKICTPLSHHENNNSTFTVPLKVTLSYAFNYDDTVEVPDDATGFAVKTHVHESTGIEAGQIRIARHSSQRSLLETQNWFLMLSKTCETKL
jgi:hypothetical protein